MRTPGRLLLPSLLTLAMLALSTSLAGCGMQGLPIEDGRAQLTENLPPEAIDTIELIQEGGPFPYSQDGTIYYNREGLLPSRPDGYYHVYTVETPGIEGRGDRRLVAGRGSEYYYSPDHYVSFIKITGLLDAGEEGSQAQQAGIQPGPGEISAASLPPEARETLRLIKKGGPFPYKQDNTVFSNYEGILPKQTKGYYHEYTVVTPGASTRGARRIVAGVPGEYYYTSDHYASFKRIVE
jgi:guanyl-specific ribonuclease Sa